ncbi:MAG TPA: glycosyltransferase family 39 protein [Anaerolineae bacterium]|nr:glycosyltransferase family 39 protein [Anaerolineae bacterium]
MKSAVATIARLRWKLCLALITLSGAALRLIGLERFPPGLHFDEAVYGLMALEIYHGQLPVFFSAYTGREPLYMYLMAGVFRLAGIGIVGIRLTSALIGAVTLPLVYLLLRELYGNRRLALIAASVTALSYWHLTVSRNGYPNILIPPLECLALFCLWRGYRDGHQGWLTLGGAFVGLVLYTYLAARLFPVTVLLFFLYCLLVDRQRFLRRFGGLVLAALVAVLVFAPLGLHFIHHPHDFWERADQVLALRQAGGATAFRVYGDNILKTVGGFFLKGDPRWHYNLPGKPIFDPLMAAAFGIGIVVALKRWRKPEYALLLIWTAGMCLPAILTVDLMPQGQRSFGITPAIFGLAALGLETLLAAAQRRLSPPLRRVAPLALVALLAFEGGSTVRTYFGEWVRRPETYEIFNTEYVQLAQEAAARLDAGETVVIQALHYKHPTVIFVAPRTVDAVWLYGGRSLVIPQRGNSAVTYLRAADNPPADPIAALTAELTEPLAPLPDPFGGAAVTLARLKPGVLEAERDLPAQAAFADEIEILDWRLPQTTPRDASVDVLLHWRALRSVAEGRVLKVHLVDANGVLWSQGDAANYLSEQWRAGDTVYELVEIPLPDGIPAGRYEVQLVFAREGGGQLPVLREGRPSGSALVLGPLTLEVEGRTLKPLQAGVDFGPLRAIAFEETLRTATPGGSVEFEVTWQATQAPSRDVTVTLTLRDATGAALVTQETPLGASYPTSLWQAGETVRVIYLLPLPALEPGLYQLSLEGVEGVETGGRLALGQVQVAGQARLYTAPPLSHPLEAQLGEAITFLGYDLAPESLRPGETLSLRLVWRAESRPGNDAKVFVHLVGADGLIYGQDDSVPAQWQRPTLGWETGEIILDEHAVTVSPQAPAGDYTLYIGMYETASFARLPLTVAGPRQPDDRLQLAVIRIAP